ncbi:uncharacterized protein HaLaN_11156, partial [Haematococcus lacustris]
MPQKPVIKGKKIEKKAAANRHGKVAKTTKGKATGGSLTCDKGMCREHADRVGAGHFEKPPVKTKLLEAYKDNKELTKTINATNESNIAAKAENAGGRLKSPQQEPDQGCQHNWHMALCHAGHMRGGTCNLRQ